MFDTKPLIPERDPAAVRGSQAPGGEDAPEPLDRLGEQICELAGHLAAATCRFLVLLGDFDAREGWAGWDMPSCAAWLSWKCQLSSGTAREHVRVARALRVLPVTRAEFAAGRLSFAKVRALTRIATPVTEADLAELAGPMTANQLERFARAHRKVSAADDAAARVRRRLAWRWEEDGSLAITVHLPPLDGATILKALRAAAGDLEHPHDGPSAGSGVSAETSAAGSAEAPPGASAGSSRGLAPTSSSLADALMAVAESFLAGKVATAANPDIYQVIVHVGTDVLAGGTARPTGDPPPAAETRGAGPAGRGRCHVEDGPAISPTTAEMIACESTLSWMLHDRDGTLLDIGRRRRRPTAALRRAVRDRDGGRCRFPGCESRRVDLHHVQFWRNGGKTSYINLVSLCKHHHRLVHDRGYFIAAIPGGGFTFTAPDGRGIPASPAPPGRAGGDSIADWHDAAITPDTIVPAWYGERLNLDYAIATCFANAANREKAAAA